MGISHISLFTYCASLEDNFDVAQDGCQGDKWDILDYISNKSQGFYDESLWYIKYMWDISKTL